MKLGMKLAALASIGVAFCATVAGPLSPEPAQAFGNPRIVVNVAGAEAGTVEFENVESHLPELLFNPDNGELVMPTNYCGLSITHVGGISWYDAYGGLVAAENHGEVNYVSGQGYMFMGEDITNAYLGGMDFTGALSTCDENAPWFFPIPLSYGGNGPQFGAQQLVLELDPDAQIEFLDDAAEPLELPDLYEDWDVPDGSLEELCQQVPEFCEPDEDPDPWTVQWELMEDLTISPCTFLPHGCSPDSRPYAGLTLGCMAYATGCNPDPQPRSIETFVAPGSGPSSAGESLEVSPVRGLQPTSR